MFVVVLITCHKTSPEGRVEPEESTVILWEQQEIVTSEAPQYDKVAKRNCWALRLRQTSQRKAPIAGIGITFNHH